MQPDTDAMIAEAERRATAAAVQRGNSDEELRERWQRARSELPPTVYQRALEIHTDSVLLTWDECIRMSQLLEPVQ
jgi:hypothetical protein